MPAATRIPDSPLGIFVKRNYAPKNRPGVYRRLKSKGFVPPTARTPGAGTGAGGVTDTTAGASGATRAQRRVLPRELVGRAGVIGPWGKMPRIDLSAYEIVPNEFGSFFAAPRDELTGLGAQDRADVRSYDTETERQRPVIQGAYSDLQTALNENAEAAKARLASLGSIIGGAAPIVGAPQGVTGYDERLASSQRAQANAGAAVTVGQMSALPAIAATEGAEFLNKFLADRLTGRRTLLTGKREQATERLKDSIEQDRFDRELAATLRGQDITLLGTQITTRGGIAKAKIQEQSDQEQKQAELEARLRIAELQGNVSEANNIRTQIAKIQAAQIAAAAKGKADKGKAKAGRPGTPQYQVARRQFSGSVRADFERKDKDGNVTNYNEDARPTIIRGLGLGLRPIHILQALRGYSADYGTRANGQVAYSQDVVEFANALVAGGIARKRAGAITKQLLGTDPFRSDPRRG